MTGDLRTNELATFAAGPGLQEMAAPFPESAVLHRYGRLTILDAPTQRVRAFAEAAPAPVEMTMTESFGAAALAQRNSAEFKAQKEARSYAGRSWGAEAHSDEAPQPIHPPDDLENAAVAGAPEPGEAAAASLSQRMTGKIAVGVVLVSGTQQHLQLSQAEKTLVIAEVQNGLSWLADQSPARDVTFVHDIRTETVSVPEVNSGQNYEAFERPWRDAALAQMGFAGGNAGVRAYANQLKASLHTNWVYVAFFTKYRLKHFAYAQVGGPKLVMHYQNDGWGPSNIDRVFAHETGHIFRAPDEYAASGCNCGGSWGHFGRPNSNCANCAPNGGVACIMQANEWAMCDETPYHFGYNGLPAPAPAIV